MQQYDNKIITTIIKSLLMNNNKNNAVAYWKSLNVKKKWRRKINSKDKYFFSILLYSVLKKNILSTCSFKNRNNKLKDKPMTQKKVEEEKHLSKRTIIKV